MGAGTSTITKLGIGTNGQVLIGATTADPAFATLSSSDSSISFTPGANSLSLQVAAGSGVIKTITGNTGGAESPSAGNFNILGTGSVTVAGTANTETVQLTGLTNHAVLIGAGTATITNLGPTATAGQVLQSTGSSSDPAFSTATYPATTTVSQILYSSATNVVSGLATANRGVLTTGATGIPVVTALAADGQLIIGSTAGAPAAATLTAGTNVSITNGSNSITINATGSGDVVGPASATDNALVRFDGTTGKLIKNGITVEDNTGNIVQSTAVSGASLSTIISNTSNTASATAFHQVQVAGATASDAFYEANISGGQAWTWGLDNSDSDSWVLSATATPGTTNVMHVATSGEINYPLQPAFYAFLPTSDLNVTGDNTPYTIGAVTALTEVFDQNADFNPATGVFTAPVTGRYYAYAYVRLSDLGAAHTYCSLNIITSNRTFFLGDINPAVIKTIAVVSNIYGQQCSAFFDMDAADTFTIATVVSGSTKTVDIIGGASTTTGMGGYLVC